MSIIYILHSRSPVKPGTQVISCLSVKYISMLNRIFWENLQTIQLTMLFLDGMMGIQYKRMDRVEILDHYVMIGDPDYD